ncbi:TetR/AcrR family transcriptional regulator [Streptomyces sp. NPDC059255]|uniref:TetR/AcrR family transcriptional regulator n=1 Tax=Streptomyces sp. NPDC059255 TaxID=3346793 RepID=UPI0036977EE5
MNRPVVPFGKPRGERADAVRNRERLLETAREMIAEHGVEKLTMDGLAERAGLGKGTVFRRFGTRAGIFRALLEDDERRFQEQVMSGPPPLGPGADPKDRLIAYGRARIPFLLHHHAMARAAMERDGPAPESGVNLSRLHIRMLLGRTSGDMPELDSLTLQLAAALEGPLLLYLSAAAPTAPPDPDTARHLVNSWQALIECVTGRHRASPTPDEPDAVSEP